MFFFGLDFNLLMHWLDIFRHAIKQTYAIENKI